MIAVNASDGSARLSLNTCQACNPMNINYEIEDDNLTVSVADLDGYADKFALWSGPVE